MKIKLSGNSVLKSLFGKSNSSESVVDARLDTSKRSIGYIEFLNPFEKHDLQLEKTRLTLSLEGELIPYNYVFRRGDDEASQILRDKSLVSSMRSVAEIRDVISVNDQGNYNYINEDKYKAWGVSQSELDEAWEKFCVQCDTAGNEMPILEIN